MRKILTTSMVVGAALLVAACGGGEKAANNTADNEVTNDAGMDMNEMDSGNTMGGDANMMNDSNAATTADNTAAENAAN